MTIRPVDVDDFQSTAKNLLEVGGRHPRVDFRD